MANRSDENASNQLGFMGFTPHAAYGNFSGSGRFDNTANRANTAERPNAAARPNANAPHLPIVNAPMGANAGTRPNVYAPKPKANAETMPNVNAPKPKANAETMPNVNAPKPMANTGMMPNVNAPKPMTNTGMMPNVNAPKPNANAGMMPNVNAPKPNANAGMMPNVNAPKPMANVETKPNVSYAQPNVNAPKEDNANESMRPNMGENMMNAMEKKKPSAHPCSYKEGTLPSCAPLGVGFIPFQQENPPMYKVNEALTKGTLFPGLDLPWFNVSNTSNPYEGTPLGELMALSFAIKELNLYLDTHKDDYEALDMLKKLNKLYAEATEKFNKTYGPTMVTDITFGDEYTWLQDPWPWEFGQRGGSR
jgi:spore coat protein JB